MSITYTVALPWPGPARHPADYQGDIQIQTNLTRTTSRVYTHAVIWYDQIWEATWCGSLALAEKAARTIRARLVTYGLATDSVRIVETLVAKDLLAEYVRLDAAWADAHAWLDEASIYDTPDWHDAEEADTRSYDELVEFVEWKGLTYTDLDPRGPECDEAERPIAYWPRPSWARRAGSHHRWDGVPTLEVPA